MLVLRSLERCDLQNTKFNAGFLHLHTWSHDINSGLYFISLLTTQVFCCLHSLIHLIYLPKVKSSFYAFQYLVPCYISGCRWSPLRDPKLLNTHSRNCRAICQICNYKYLSPSPQMKNSIISFWLKTQAPTAPKEAILSTAVSLEWKIQ